MNLPFFQALDKAQNILLAGAGGGFDIFCGLPLYFSLKRAGKTVHLANLSFTQLDYCDGEQPIESLIRVLPNTGGSQNYFPEVHLASWLSQRFGETPVYAIKRTGVKPVTEAYRWFAKNLHIDTVILVDGGTDILMRGDEAGLGTPQEDMASLAAAHSLTEVQRKFIVCLGFGIDTFHGVCHAHFLENVAALTGNGGYLGAWSLLPDSEEFQLYREAMEFVTARTPDRASIVNTSIIAAVMGRFGDFHSTKRTQESELFINPLMGLYWAFHLEHVARQNLYLDQIRDTNTYPELSMNIEKFRASLPQTRPWKDLPV